MNGSPASGGFSCSACHGSAPGTGSIEVLGAPLTYRPGTAYDLRVRIADPDLVGAGFQLSAENPGGTPLGSFTITDAVKTAFMGDPAWITHTDAGVDASISNWLSDDNGAEYQLRWTAPAVDAGPVTFHAAGVAINDGHNPSGDHVYLSAVTAFFCPADTDGNGSVDIDDLMAVILDWGTDGSAGNSDVNGSGLVDVDDIMAVIMAWGGCL
jgi:hypothetical protein